jgi:hypothetical protein
MFARNRTNELKRQKMQKAQERMTQEENIRKAEEIRHKKEIERRRNPRTKEDFDILYEELEVQVDNTCRCGGPVKLTKLIPIRA